LANNDLLFLFPKSLKEKENLSIDDYDDPLEELLNEFSDVYEFCDDEEEASEESLSFSENQHMDVSNIYEKLELLKSLQQKTKYLMREIKIFTS